MTDTTPTPDEIQAYERGYLAAMSGRDAENDFIAAGLAAAFAERDKREAVAYPSGVGSEHVTPPVNTDALAALTDLEQENHSYGTGERGDLFALVRRALTAGSEQLTAEEAAWTMGLVVDADGSIRKSAEAKLRRIAGVDK